MKNNPPPIVVSSAWYSKQLPLHIIIDIEGSYYIAFNTPIKKLKRSDLKPYTGHRASLTSLPDYLYSHYGLVLDNDPKLSVTMHIRVSNQQKEKLDAKAAELGIPTSEYIRAKLFD